MKKLMYLIGAVVLATNCFAQSEIAAAESAKIFAGIIEKQENVRINVWDMPIWASETVSQELKDEIVKSLNADGHKSRYGFISSPTTCPCKVTFGERPVDIFSVKTPDGRSYIAIIEQKKNHYVFRFCDLEGDWEAIFKKIYGKS